MVFRVVFRVLFLGGCLIPTDPILSPCELSYVFGRVSNPRLLRQDCLNSPIWMDNWKTGINRMLASLRLRATSGWNGDYPIFKQPYLIGGLCCSIPVWRTVLSLNLKHFDVRDSCDAPFLEGTIGILSHKPAFFRVNEQICMCIPVSKWVSNLI